MENIENKVVCPNCNQPIEIQVAAYEDNERLVCPKCNEAIGISSQAI